jgi:UDP-glucose 4-epimerase
MMNKYRVPKIVYFSSGGAIYDSSNGTLLAEDSPTNPLSSYGIVKLAVEKYILLYRHLYGLDYLILRACNPYGPYHHSVSQGLINVTLKKILAKEPVIVWGDGRAIKDYIYVRDYAAIVRRLVKKNVWNEIINVGTGRGHSVNQILSAIKSVAGSFKVKYQAGRQIDAPRVVLDIKKLRRLIRPDFVPLKQGIAKTFDWLKQHHE